MKVIINCFVFFSFVLTAYSQEHIPVSPDLENDALFEAVATNFTPNINLSYGDARDILFGEVYRVNDSLHCIYTDWPIHMPPGADPTIAVFQDGAGINTEHTWPQSLGAAGAAKSDMHHLFPSRVNVNSDRGSLKFAEVTDNSTDRWYYLSSTLTSPPSIGRDNYSEYLQNNAFEPREISKGNIARAMFYFYTIYRNNANSSGAGFFESQRATLCQWHIEDPIDELEWTRTFQIAAHQSDKPNPFIIDCTLAARMYCPEIQDEICVTTATNSIIEPLEVTVFPNPSKGQSHIKGFAPECGLLQLRYFNLQGQWVQSEELKVTQGSFELDIILPYAGFWHCEMRLQGRNDLYLKTLPIVVAP